MAAKPKFSYETILPTIVIGLPGLKPDSRIHVFNQPFDVHSTALKMHSEWFRKNMASKKTMKWATQVNKDSEWSLEPRLGNVSHAILLPTLRVMDTFHCLSKPMPIYPGAGDIKRILTFWV